ncbi:MAG TPA: hypothetical protein VGV57_03920 [Thermoleophilaceae bacterium]|nr:hypothetical protein [Thermoleophilaceae bacterium]
MTTGERSHALYTVDLDLDPNEASDLLPVEARELLRARGWDLPDVLHEGSVEDSVAVLGHTRGPSAGEDAWEIVRPRFRATDNVGRTEDAEACTRLDGGSTWSARTRGARAVRSRPSGRSWAASARATS